MGSVPKGPDGLASTWRLSCWPGCSVSPASKMPPRPCPRRGPPYAHNHTEPPISLSSSWYGASLELKKIKIKMSNECQKERSVCLLGDVWGWRCVRTGGGAQQAARWCGQAGDKPRRQPAGMDRLETSLGAHRVCGCQRAHSSAQSCRGTGKGAHLSTGPWVPLFASLSPPPHLERGECSLPALRAERLAMANPWGVSPFTPPNRADKGCLVVTDIIPPVPQAAAMFSSGAAPRLVHG